MSSIRCAATTRTVRRADTGCMVYIDAGAIPTGMRHGIEHCPCVKAHGPEEFDEMVSTIKSFLAEDEGKHAVFDAKPSVEIAHVLLGIGSKQERAWRKNNKSWWSSVFAK
ncbi:hypothetical protein SCUP515_10511 [Seiridium cupressi]